MGASTVKATCGATTKDLELVGKSIGDIRKEQKEALNIPDGAKSFIGGKEVKDKYNVKPGDEVTFSKQAGSNG